MCSLALLCSWMHPVQPLQLSERQRATVPAAVTAKQASPKSTCCSNNMPWPCCPPALQGHWCVLTGCSACGWQGTSSQAGKPPDSAHGVSHGFLMHVFAIFHVCMNMCSLALFRHQAK